VWLVLWKDILPAGSVGGDVDKKEGFVVSRPIPDTLETATVVHEEAQVASCSQQGMWKRLKGLFCCVCWAA